MPLSAEQRTQRARMAAHARWAKANRYEGTAPARKAFLNSFLEKVDPDWVLPEAERERRAESALKEHMARLAFASSRKRAAGAR